MKHIKTFESLNNLKYKIGNYVVINRKDEFKGKVAKIYMIEDSEDNGQSRFMFYTEYDWYWNYELRLATSEEIEQYKLETQAKKYNL